MDEVRTRRVRLPVRAIVCIALIAACSTATTAEPDPTTRLCRNTTGERDGFFHTFWKDGGDACMILGARGRYTVRYTLGSAQNLVVGRGWRTGSTSRTIGYRAKHFDPGTNSYLGLYGWSVDPLVEYYVIENWGSGFTPPGPDAKPIGTVDSDGGRYTIYRTERVRQPSIRGVATFVQYWSVRTTRQTTGRRHRITFANHVAAWRRLGMPLGTMEYQVLATEGFGSTGNADIVVDAAPTAKP